MTQPPTPTDVRGLVERLRSPDELAREAADTIERLADALLASEALGERLERAVAAFQKRADEQAEWLLENAPRVVIGQKHLDEGGTERNYWHYGYMVALRDIIRQLTLSPQEQHAGNADPNYPPKSSRLVFAAAAPHPEQEALPPPLEEQES